MNRVAVIGAGPTGLVTVKTLLQHKVKVKCFNRDQGIGGLWNYMVSDPDSGYEKNYKPGQISYPLYKGMKTNTAWLNTTYSDFLPNKISGSITHPDMLDYYKKYAHNFNLYPHIQNNSDVISLDKDKSKWVVTYNQKGKPKSETFDKVLVATGFVRYPKEITFENEESFKGVCIHSSRIRNESSLFRNKNVLFVGGGYSGMDIATIALSKGANHVAMIPTSHFPNKDVWVWNRREPTNSTSTNESALRQIEWDYRITYESCISSYDYKKAIGSISRNFLNPDKDRDLNRCVEFPTDVLGITDSTDYLQNQINSNRFSLKKQNIRYLTENDVFLDDGTVLSNIDVIVKATGYVPKFPFLDNLMDEESQLKCEFLKYMLPVTERMDGLAMVHMQRSLVVLPVAELNARFLCQTFVPKPYVDKFGSLYTLKERSAMVNAFYAERDDSMRYVRNYAGHMEHLASEMDCAPPDIRSLLQSSRVEDVRLGVALYHGPYLGLRFRIRGMGSLPDAAKRLVQVSQMIMGDRFDQYVTEYLDQQPKSIII